MPEHVAELFERWGPRFADREVLRFADRSWTWSQWADRVRRNAAAQRAAGIGPGDRVIFLDKNHPASLETTLGAALCGSAAAQLNFRLSAEEYRHLLDDSAARLVLVGHEYADVIRAVGGPHDEYEQWLAAQPPLDGRHAGEDCFLQLYTSGTTGLPKGAMLTHRGLITHAEATAIEFGAGSDSVIQAVMPMYHVGGTSWSLMALWAGGSVRMHRDLEFEPVLDAMGDGVTHTFLVPAVLQAMLELPGIAERDFSPLDTIRYGASPIPEGVLRRCLDTFQARFLGAYGMTETCGILTALPDEAHRDPEHPRRLRSVGTPITGVELRVVDPDTGTNRAAGAVGEVWVRTDQTFQGYWRNPEATAEVRVADGWIRTGDAGSLDADGYLFLIDRIKDMIISGGENIYPAEIERVLLQHPTVAEVAVIGIENDRWGEVPKAYVVAVAGAAPQPDELIEHCRANLARYKCPAEVEIIPELPRNPTGKILKRVLRTAVTTA